MAAKAGVIVDCPVPQCQVLLNASATGNIGTVFFSADLTATSPAAATFTYSEAFTTGGPVRPGLIALIFFSDGDYGAGGSSKGAGSLGPYSCTGTWQTTQFCYNNAILPVSLGDAIPIQLQLLISRSATLPGMPDGGSRDLFLKAQFFENDAGEPGDPVNVSLAPETAPEPATAWLWAGAALALAALRHRERRTRPARVAVRPLPPNS
jgi:hypothetical protein